MPGAEAANHNTAPWLYQLALMPIVMLWYAYDHVSLSPSVTVCHSWSPPGIGQGSQAGGSSRQQAAAASSTRGIKCSWHTLRHVVFVRIATDSPPPQKRAASLTQPLPPPPQTELHSHSLSTPVLYWSPQELSKGPKLVLRADGEQQLLAALEAARAAGIPYHSIAEAVPGSSSGGGSSSEVVVPRKSRTILAIGPLPAEDLPRIAGGLVLL